MTHRSRTGKAWILLLRSASVVLSHAASNLAVREEPEGREGPEGLWPARQHRKSGRGTSSQHPDITGLKFQPPGLNPHISLGRMGSVSGLLQVVLRVSERHPLICFAGNPRATLLLHLLALQPLFAIDFLGLVEANQRITEIIRKSRVFGNHGFNVQAYHCLNKGANNFSPQSILDIS